jgi:hypothetical protein
MGDLSLEEPEVGKNADPLYSKTDPARSFEVTKARAPKGAQLSNRRIRIRICVKEENIRLREEAIKEFGDLSEVLCLEVSVRVSVGCGHMQTPAKVAQDIFTIRQSEMRTSCPALVDTIRA